LFEFIGDFMGDFMALGILGGRALGILGLWGF